MMDEMLEIFDVMPSCCGALGYVVVGLLGCWALFHLWSRKKVYSFKEKHVLVSVNVVSTVSTALSCVPCRRSRAAVVELGKPWLQRLSNEALPL